MGIKRIGDLPKLDRCTSPDHDPPSHWAPRPGIYEHKCSACGRVTVMRIDGVRC